MNIFVREMKKVVRRSPLTGRIPGSRFLYQLQSVKAIVSEEHGFAFFPVPKIANRSIKLVVAEKLDISGQQNKDIHHWNWKTLPMRKIRNSDLYCFAFVRHPIDRLASCYSQKIVLYERILGSKKEFWGYGDIFSKDMEFEDFARAVVGIPDRYSDVHFRSQSYLMELDKHRPYDFVGRFETLESDWELMQEKFGFSALPKTNVSPKIEWQKHLSEEAVSLVENRYAADYSAFGYERIA